MIFLVTGEINEGKTRYMQNLYREIGEGDGFVCPKVIENEKLIRYDIQRLGNDNSIPFACPVDSLPEDWDESCRYGKYSFYNRAIQFAEGIIKRIIAEKTEPFYIDEIGPLEIEKREGLFDIVKQIIDSKLEGFIVVRRALIDKFHETFNIKPQISPIIRIKISGDNSNMS